MTANAFNPDRSKAEVYTKSEIDGIINTLSNAINARIDGLARVKLWGIFPSELPDEIESYTLTKLPIGYSDAVTIDDPTPYDELEVFACSTFGTQMLYRIPAKTVLKSSADTNRPVAGGSISFAESYNNGGLGVCNHQLAVYIEKKIINNQTVYKAYAEQSKTITVDHMANQSGFQYAADINPPLLDVLGIYGIKFPVPYVPPTPPQING